MMRRLVAASLVPAIVLVAGSAAGQAAEPTGYEGYADEPPSPWNTSLSVSPIHLVLPVLQLTGELGIIEKLSLQADVAFGRVYVLDPATAVAPDSPKMSSPMFMAAAGVRYYPVGDFYAGIPLVGEVRYNYVRTDQLASAALYNIASNLGVAALTGFKFTRPSGFTLEFLGGAMLSVASFSTHDARTDAFAPKAPTGTVFGVLELKFGYTFAL